MIDFDPEFDKLPDQPVTIGGDKSAAAWHGADTDLSTLDKVTASYDEALREARAERDALQRGLVSATERAEAAEVERDNLIRIIAQVSLHDAEVKAQALDNAAASLSHDSEVLRQNGDTHASWGQVADIAVHLKARAAAIREEGK